MVNYAMGVLNLQAAAVLNKANAVAQESADGASFLSLLQGAASTENIAEAQAKEAGSEPVVEDDESVLVKVLGGELEGLTEADIIGEIKKEVADIIVRSAEDDAGEQVDMGKLLEVMFGAPEEIIPEIIAALVDPEIIFDDFDRGQVEFSISGSLEAYGADAPALVSVSDAEQIIAGAAEYIYAGGELTGVPEQVQENIADVASLIEETGDFKSAVAGYAAGKAEANAARFDAENIREAVRQALDGEAPRELEKTGAAEKPTLLELASYMRKPLNIVQVAYTEVQGTAQNFAEVAEVGEKIMPEAPVAEVIAAYADNLVAGAQSEAVNIRSFAGEMSRLIAGRVHISQPVAVRGGGEVFELRLRLKPEALGEVFLKVTYSGGEVALSIVAANAEAERAILSQMGELRDGLGEQDISLASFDVNNFDRQSSQRQSQQDNNGRRVVVGMKSEAAAARDEAEMREAAVSYMRSRRFLYKTI